MYGHFWFGHLQVCLQGPICRMHLMRTPTLGAAICLSSIKYRADGISSAPFLFLSTHTFIFCLLFIFPRCSLLFFFYCPAFPLPLVILHLNCYQHHCKIWISMALHQVASATVPSILKKSYYCHFQVHTYVSECLLKHVYMLEKHIIFCIMSF